MLRHRVLVEREGNGVEGRAEPGPGEESWLFHPEQPWLPGDYEILAAARLEDRSGNSLAKPFEVDRSTGDRPAPSDEPFRLGFEIRPD